MKLKSLAGSGERIARLAAPVLIVALVLNALRPEWFDVGGPARVLKPGAAGMLAVGVVVWAWSVVLILTRVPRHELITSGPFAVVKHPLYTAVGLLVVPSIGLLLGTWLGILIGAVIYAGSRMFSPEEERALARTFGPAWDEYARKVALPWL